MRRVDWVFIGAWMLIAFYVLGSWTLAATAYALLSHVL